MRNSSPATSIVLLVKRCLKLRVIYRCTCAVFAKLGSNQVKQDNAVFLFVSSMVMLLKAKL